MSAFAETNSETTFTMTTLVTILPYESVVDQAFGPISEEPLHDIDLTDLTDLTVQPVETEPTERPEDRGHFQSPRLPQPCKLVRSTNELPPSFFIRPPFPKRSIAESPLSTMSYGFYDSPDNVLEELQLPTMFRTETVSFTDFPPFPPDAPPDATGFQTPLSYSPPSSPPPLKYKHSSRMY